MKRLALILGVVITICVIVYVSMIFYFTDNTDPKKKKPVGEDPPVDPADPGETDPADPDQEEEVVDVKHEEIKTDENPGS